LRRALFGSRFATRLRRNRRQTQRQEQ
jgi:hypothetical protein